MILHGAEIRRMLELGTMKTNAEHEDLHIGPNSVDVTLDSEFIEYEEDETHHLSTSYSKHATTKQINIPPEGSLRLFPNDFVLGSVRERFWFTDQEWRKTWVPMIEGRSSLARCGLQVHMTAGFGDLGFEGVFTLEIKNASNNSIVLTPGIRVAQIYWTKAYASNPDEKYCYHGAYDSDHKCGPVAPRLGEGRL